MSSQKAPERVMADPVRNRQAYRRLRWFYSLPRICYIKRV